MLTEIRDRSSGWFAWIIAGLIIIPMAFWGVHEYAGSSPEPAIVTVGEQKITQRQFQAQLNTAQQQQRQAMGERANNELLNSDFFKQTVLQRMVNSAMIEQVAEQQNYQIGDEQLADFIKQSDFFQVDGKFDQTAYERYIQSTRYSKTQFENRVRDDNRIGQVMSGYQNSAIVLPEEVKQLLAIQAEKRTFDIITLKQKDYVEGVSVSEQEISDYYTENDQQFLDPEKMSINFVELDINQILNEIEVDEDEIRAYYDENADSYISQETRKTRHILISTNDGEDEAQQKAKADGLVEQLRAGSDFALLAKEYSDDTGSASNGGDLGVVEKGQMVAEFEEATFALEQGKISDPVKSQFGYHIIQVEKINLPVQQSFDDVKFDIEQEEKERQAEELLISRVDELRNLAYEQPESLDAIAEELSLKVQRTALFDRNSGAGVANFASVRQAAFTEEILEDEVNSEPLEVAEGRYIVLRKREHKPSQPKALETVSEQIKTLLTNDKAAQAAEQAGASLLSKAEVNWQSLVDDETLSINTHTVALADNDRKVTPEVLRKISTLRLDNATQKLDSIVSRNGDFNIVRLTKIEPGDVNSVSEQVKESTRRLLATRNGQSLAAGYLDTLRDQFKPEIDENLL